MRGVQFSHFIVAATLALPLVGGCQADWNRKFERGEGGGTTTSPGEGGGDLFPTTTETPSESACEGECFPWKSALFEDLSLFRIVPFGEPSTCPESAPLPGATVHGNLQPSPMVCPECSCAPGACSFSEKMWVSAATCANAENSPALPWDVAPEWEGECTAEGALPPGLLCGGVPCVQSLTVSALQSAPCTSTSVGEEIRPAPHWGLTAQECLIGPLSGDGCGVGEACISPPSEGFSLCLTRWGDDLTAEQCPVEYPRFLVVYADHEDERECEPCSCGPPEGGDCSALVSVYKDNACAQQVAAVTVTPTEAGCVDLPAGSALGSKSAAFVQDQARACAQTGGPTGEIVPTLPLTLCCQKEFDPTK